MPAGCEVSTDQMAMEVAKACNVKPEDTYILFPTVPAWLPPSRCRGRMLEQTCHKMFEKGFDADRL